jgi:RNA polymerase sigma-70 factor (ECF subfamily)
MAMGNSWPTTRPSLLGRLHNAGDAEAWAAFVDVYKPLLYRYCLKRGLQDADALDVVQRVLPKVQRFRYDPQKGRFRDWLGTVTRHEVVRKLKELNSLGQPAGGSEPNLAMENLDDPGDDVVWQQVFYARILESALRTVRTEFDEQKWRVFEAVGITTRPSDAGLQVVWQDAVPAEVAATFGMPVSEVYKIKSKILKRLKDEVLYLAEDMPVLGKRRE